VVDLSATTSVDPAGLSVLVHALGRVREAGGDLTLTGLTADVSQALKSAGLERLFVTTPGWAHPSRGVIGQG
jgi:anti-anti-sigma factor